MVSKISLAHLWVMCDGHITRFALGRPNARTWIVARAIRVLPAPHSATMRAALAVRKYFAVPVTARACAGSGLRKSVANSGAIGSLGPCSGG